MVRWIKDVGGFLLLVSCSVQPSEAQITQMPLSKRPPAAGRRLAGGLPCGVSPWCPLPLPGGRGLGVVTSCLRQEVTQDQSVQETTFTNTQHPVIHLLAFHQQRFRKGCFSCFHGNAVRASSESCVFGSSELRFLTLNVQKMQ